MVIRYYSVTKTSYKSIDYIIQYTHTHTNKKIHKNTYQQVKKNRVILKNFFIYIFYFSIMSITSILNELRKLYISFLKTQKILEGVLFE